MYRFFAIFSLMGVTEFISAYLLSRYIFDKCIAWSISQNIK